MTAIWPAADICGDCGWRSCRCHERRDRRDLLSTAVSPTPTVEQLQRWYVTDVITLEQLEDGLARYMRVPPLGYDEITPDPVIGQKTSVVLAWLLLLSVLPCLVVTLEWASGAL